MEQLITKKLQQAFSPDHLQVDNDSHLHQGPRTDSHFKVLIVSDSFKDLSLVKRHQLIYKSLDKEVMETIHALQLTTWTVEQWQKAPRKKIASSQCAK